MKVAAGVVLAAAVLTPYLLQHRGMDRLKREHEQLRSQAANLAATAVPVADAIDTNELARLRNEHQELLQLRGQLASLRREKDELARQLAARAPRTNQTAAGQEKAVDRAWVQTMLDGPLSQQGSAAGSLRGKLLRGEGVTPAELALRDALSSQQLNQTLERSPTAFADFQAAYIQAAVGINDPAKMAQIHELVRATYDHAVAQGLDIPSKPAEGAEDWVQKRHQLDRRATRAVQNLLTPEEKGMFDRAFLGVMGVDLGTGVDKSNYPPGFLGAAK
jgi:hypothetical protein